MNVQQYNDEKSIQQRAWLLVALIIGLLALAVAWRWTGLSEYLDVTRSVAMLRSSEFIQIPVVAISLIFFASVAAVPLSVIIVISAVAYGVTLGPTYVLVGAEIGAASSFVLGKFLGHSALKLFAGDKVSLLSQQLANNGLLAVFLIRLVPAAPFAIVNMVAGASHIRTRDFLVGTALGMVPGIVMITFFVDQIVAAIFDPGWGSIMLVFAALLLLVGGIIVFNYWGKRSRLE